MNKKKCAFTLIELIIVVTVVLILALIALPNFNKSRKRVIEKEGIATIKLIAAAQRIYRMEQGSYAKCTCDSKATCDAEAIGCNPLLKLMLNTKNWGYTANDSGGITATAQASAGMSGCTYNLVPANYDSEPTGSSSCP